MVNPQGKTKEQILSDLAYALGKFNWGASPLDAKAIDILNTIAGDISSIIDRHEEYMAYTINKFLDSLPDKVALTIEDGDEYPFKKEVRKMYMDFLLKELEENK